MFWEFMGPAGIERDYFDAVDSGFEPCRSGLGESLNRHGDLPACPIASARRKLLQIVLI